MCWGLHCREAARHRRLRTSMYMALHVVVSLSSSQRPCGVRERQTAFWRTDLLVADRLLADLNGSAARELRFNSGIVLEAKKNMKHCIAPVFTTATQTCTSTERQMPYKLTATN